MNDLLPRPRWISRKTEAAPANRPRAAAVRVLCSMSRDPEVNHGSLHVAAAIMTSLASRGVRSEPIPSLDADGDVVLTWVKGDVRGSALVSSTGVSSVVSRGRKIAHLGEEVPVSDESIAQLSFIALAGAYQGWQPNLQSSSTTSTLSVDRFLSHECETLTQTYPVLLTPHSSNSRRETTDGESSPSFGSSALVMKHVTRSA